MWTENGIQCANCGEANLHQYLLESFTRSAEDSYLGRRVVVAHENVWVDGEIRGNPSSRRDGIKIYFWCEHCDTKTVMSIAQHKGSEYIEFGSLTEKCNKGTHPLNYADVCEDVKEYAYGKAKREGK